VDNVASALPIGKGFYAVNKGAVLQVKCMVCGTECEVYTKPVRWFRTVVLVHCSSCPGLMAIFSKWRYADLAGSLHDHAVYIDEEA
jgi:hypothetical protein